MGSERKVPTHFDEYEKQAAQLELLAKGLSKKSAKYAALERAGLALGFVTMHHHREFQQFLRDQKKPLSPAQRKHLKSLGFE